MGRSQAVARTKPAPLRLVPSGMMRPPSRLARKRTLGRNEGWACDLEWYVLLHGSLVDRETIHRRKAAELRQRARTEHNVSTRLDLELLALGYDRLADQAQHNAKNNVVYEYDPEALAQRRQRRKRHQAQAQQQQQQRPNREQ
jgi:hypothetical protein